MVGHRPASYEDTPAARVERIFDLMDDVSLKPVKIKFNDAFRMEMGNYRRKNSSMALAKTVQLLAHFQCIRAQFKSSGDNRCGSKAEFDNQCVKT